MHMQSRHQLLRRQCCRLLSAMRDCPNASVRRCPMDNAMARLSLLIAAFRLDAFCAVWQLQLRASVLRWLVACRWFHERARRLSR